jgi:hypothetical protein
MIAGGCVDHKILLTKTKYSYIAENVHTVCVSLDADFSLGIPLLRGCSLNTADIKGNFFLYNSTVSIETDTNVLATFHH